MPWDEYDGQQGLFESLIYYPCPLASHPMAWFHVRPSVSQPMTTPALSESHGSVGTPVAEIPAAAIFIWATNIAPLEPPYRIFTSPLTTRPVGVPWPPSRIIPGYFSCVYSIRDPTAFYPSYHNMTPAWTAFNHREPGWKSVRWPPSYSIVPTSSTSRPVSIPHKGPCARHRTKLT